MLWSLRSVCRLHCLVTLTAGALALCCQGQQKVTRSAPPAQPRPRPTPTPTKTDAENQGKLAPSLKPQEAETPVGPQTIRWLLDEGATDSTLELDRQSLWKALPEEARENVDAENLRLEFVVSLNQSKTRFLTRVFWGGVESTLLVINEDGKVLSATTFDRRIPDLGLVNLLGDSESEVVVRVIEGTALSTYPEWWEFFQLDKSGTLEQVARVPASLSSGSKCPVYEYKNAITVPEFGVLRVLNVKARDIETDETDVARQPPVKDLTDSFELRFQLDRPQPQRKELQPSPEEWHPPSCGPKRPSIWLED